MQAYNSYNKKFYFDVLDGIIDIYNNTYQSNIKMRPADIKSNSYVEYNVDSKAKHAKFKTCDHLRISKYKNIFGKRYALNCFKESFLIRKVNCAMDICYWIIWEDKSRRIQNRKSNQKKRR